MEGLRITIWARAVSALCVLAIVLVALVHRPVELDTRLSDPQIATYLALGGTLHDLCLSEDTGGHGGHQGQLADCPACTLGKAMALAAAATGSAAPLACRAVRALWPATAVLPRPIPFLPEARAPPLRA
jgi:hypothetical protein